MAFDLGAGLGALGGGILGGAAGGNKPAGYTTKTTLEDVPPWIRGYYTDNLTGATGLRNDLTSTTNPLTGLSEDELSRVIRGDYLNPNTNPWLSAMGQDISDQIANRVQSQFEGSGRYGSGAFQELLGTSVGKALANLYGTNYQQERARQYGATLAAPGVMQGNIAAQFEPYLQFTKLIPNLKQGTTTEPYFINKAAGILGGALAGSQLARMFGDGSAGGSGGEYGGMAGTDYGDAGMTGDFGGSADWPVFE